jgi:F-type H+-transporting ATPase subunit alpha
MSTSRVSPVPLFKIKATEHGRIKDIKEAIARIEGLPHCLNGQIIDMGDGVRGMVMGFNEQEALVLVMGDNSHLRLGKPVTGVSEPFCIPMGDAFLGRMVSAMGDPCDEGGPLVAEVAIPVMKDSLPITAREPVTEFMPTGTKMVDLAIPLGKGQRQLILGDRVTGKTAIALDAIMRQKGSGRPCIFCAVGKSRSAIQKAVQTLKESGALDYTVVVVAADSAPAGEQYLAPYAAASMGEFFAARGRDVLVVFDDLTKHAWAYRQLSLLLDRPPGREAYPGDIFYVQTQLMERAGNFNAEYGGGSMTFICIAETLQGDLTGYIPSNLAAICDGQICMSTTAFAEGQRPAINLPLSLSIVGRNVQPPIVRQLGATLRASVAQYGELSRLGILQSGLSEASNRVLRMGAAIQILMQQGERVPASVGESVLLLFGLRMTDLATKPAADIAAFRDSIREFAERRDAGLLEALEEATALTATLENRLKCLMDRYFSEASALGARR